MAHVPGAGRRGRLRSLAAACAASLLIVAGTAGSTSAADPPPLPDPPPALEPIDPQVVTQAADQDWDDYNPIPGSPYVDPTIAPTIKRWNVALILTDFPGTPFAITQPEGSTIFGNPGPLAHDIPRENVPAFYKDWLNTPSAINEFQGMNRYWMEDTYGKYGVALEGYGPYELFGTQDEYFITDFANTAFCNTQTLVNGAQTGVTDVVVDSSASFAVGKIVSGFGGGLSRVITAIPDATHMTTGPATVFSATSLAGATNIKVNSIAGLVVGHTIDIGYGDRLESATIMTVGTAGPTGTGLDLAAPLTFGHASNTIIRDYTPTPVASVNDGDRITTCGRSYRNETLVQWADHVALAERGTFDNTFYVAAGQDESGTWQEFGEMRFTQNTVPDEWGPPNPEIANNWAQTRYIPWTSWRSAATIWPSASNNNSIEGEGSGMAVYAHELTHNLGIADNYNNPYAAPFQRPATGYWSMMSRGSFGGPGGTHTRWHIPSTEGTALGSQHVIRDKIKLGFVTKDNFVELNRNGLAASGPVVVDVTAREVDPGPSGQTGIHITLDGTSPVDRTTPCAVFTRSLTAPAAAGDGTIQITTGDETIRVNNDLTVGTPTNGELRRIAGISGTTLTLDAPLEGAHAAAETVSNRLNCSGVQGFENYTVEVVDQIGSDSFQADHGVLIEKNKVAERDNSCGTFNCFAWVIDAHPEDINIVDFVRPDGTVQQVTTGDPRQLTDAAFHAGLNSGSSDEWEDTANGLHFYVVDKHVDEAGVLRYRIAVQNINGAGPHARGITVDEAAGELIHERYTTCTFPLTNSGAAADIANPHPATEDASPYYGDVYRLSVSAEGEGWQAQLPNALAAAPFGGSVDVPVYVTRDLGSDVNGMISLTATSVSDPSKTSTATCALQVQAPTVAVEALDYLENVPSDGAATNRRIADAIDAIEASLGSAYWIDACTLSATQGKNVFDQQKVAIQNLVLITAPADVVAGVDQYIYTLLFAQRQLVVCAIEASEGGKADLLAAAESELALGDAAIAAGQPKDATAHYKTAWDKARKAGG
jgi:M6 family metalloprotease-like protein